MNDDNNFVEDQNLGCSINKTTRIKIYDEEDSYYWFEKNLS
jgi:hypothetical protein